MRTSSRQNTTRRTVAPQYRRTQSTCRLYTDSPIYKRVCWSSLPFENCVNLNIVIARCRRANNAEFEWSFKLAVDTDGTVIIVAIIITIRVLFVSESE